MTAASRELQHALRHAQIPLSNAPSGKPIPGPDRRPLNANGPPAFRDLVHEEQARHAVLPRLQNRSNSSFRRRVRCPPGPVRVPDHARASVRRSSASIVGLYPTTNGPAESGPTKAAGFLSSGMKHRGARPHDHGRAVRETAGAAARRD